jgi:hypothetical protein
MADSIQDAIERNYSWFLGALSGLLPEHKGEYALIHDQQLIGLFRSPGEAEREGEKRFPGATYSIQPVEDQPIDLGYFSYALD